MMSRHFLATALFVVLQSPLLGSAQPADPAPLVVNAKGKKAKGKKAKKDKSMFELKGRVHTAWRLERFDQPPSDDSDQTTNSFFIRRGRLTLGVKPLTWLRGEVSVEATEVLDLGGSLLRDAYIDIRPLKQLEFRIGQFKKPFSRLELRSPSRMRVIERGLGNDVLIEDLGYGDRDIGVRVSGRLVKSVRLDYDFGVFNGNGPHLDDIDGVKDVVGRVQIQPTKWLSIGGNGSFKFFEPDDGSNQPELGWAAGVDLRLRASNLRLHLESLFGADHEAYREHSGDPDFESPLAFNMLALLSHKIDFDVDWGFALEPILKVEFLDPDTEVVEDDLLMFTPGINAHFTDLFRLMTQAEFRNAKRNSPSKYKSNKTVTVMAAFDF